MTYTAAVHVHVIIIHTVVQWPPCTAIIAIKHPSKEQRITIQNCKLIFKAKRMSLWQYINDNTDTINSKPVCLKTS
jgi:hypothetical protein